MKQQVFDSLVILSPFPWNFRDDMWQTTHHLAREFSRVCPTLLVEPPAQWYVHNEYFRLHRLGRSLFGSQTRSVGENLAVFHRRGLPMGRLEAIRNFDLQRNAKSLRALLSKHGFRRTLLWHSFPYWSEALVKAIDPYLFVYHCLDHSTREEELELVQRADIVFCVSEGLVDKHRKLNARTFLLPNGVDLGLFDVRSTKSQPRPADLPASGRLIGFLGYINRHVDVELLLNVARSLADDNLVLIGRVPPAETAPQGKQRRALGELRSRPNVRFLGFKATSQLPAYVAAFDVCLVPFLANAFNGECDPLKFYQYAALGKPIVSTPVSVARRHSDLCHVAESHEEFIGSISKALGEPSSSELSKQRIQMARAYGWESIVERACGILSNLDATSDVRLSASPV